MSATDVKDDGCELLSGLDGDWTLRIGSVSVVSVFCVDGLIDLRWIVSDVFLSKDSGLLLASTSGSSPECRLLVAEASFADESDI